MIFTDLVFVPFLVAAAAVYWLLPRPARPWWLALTGAAFYAYYAPAALILVLGLAAATFAFGRLAPKHRWAAVLGIVLPVAVLAFFKYRGLVPAWSAAPAGSGAPVALGVGLPLAISFFTFEFVHFVADARAGKIERPSAARFASFALFFPTMIAGPIKRFEPWDEQSGDQRLAPEDVSTGVWRILTGAFKKVVIADSLAPFVAPLLTGQPGRVSAGALALGLLAYAFRIYYDFSGYSDIAIGAARLFGFRVPENFHRPYLATSPAEFWRRWHMSLSSWIFDYVYRPLGGSRKGLVRTLVNLMAAMLVSGLWHGVGWNFVAWGAYHGILLCGYRLWREAVRPRLLAGLDEREDGAGRAWRSAVWVRKAASVGVTFAAVTAGWSLFVMPLERLTALVSGAM
ncbi:MAG: MBOAT family protein [Coriobacteriaceae bacterium]|nr:MBOAT family protein [Coriobacteriaceae bacterium]